MQGIIRGVRGASYIINFQDWFLEKNYRIGYQRDYCLYHRKDAEGQESTAGTLGSEVVLRLQGHSIPATQCLVCYNQPAQLGSDSSAARWIWMQNQNHIQNLSS